MGRNVVSDNELNDQARNALGYGRDNKGINCVLKSIIDKCERPVSRVAQISIKDYNLKREHLKFENHVLKTIWNNLKNKWDDMKDKLKDLTDRLKDIKELLKKLFKAINTVLDSLKKAFYELEAVKEFKDLVNLMISWIASSLYQT